MIALDIRSASISVDVFAFLTQANSFYPIFCKLKYFIIALLIFIHINFRFEELSRSIFIQNLISDIRSGIRAIPGVIRVYISCPKYYPRIYFLSKFYPRHVMYYPPPNFSSKVISTSIFYLKSAVSWVFIRSGFHILIYGVSEVLSTPTFSSEVLSTSLFLSKVLSAISKLVSEPYQVLFFMRSVINGIHSDIPLLSSFIHLYIFLSEDIQSDIQALPNVIQVYTFI